jgi:uroporphyrinogen-III decarboxylase
METIAGMNIAEVRRRYGNRLFITGGIDVSQLMAFGTPDEVRARCEQAIREAGETGYFLGSTTELGPQVRVENILTMVDVARTWSR